MVYDIEDEQLKRKRNENFLGICYDEDDNDICFYWYYLVLK